MTRKVKKITRDRRAEAKAFDVAVGARIRERRKAAGLKQEPAAELVGISPAQLSRYENGETSTEPAMLARLAEAFGCKTSDFLDGIEVGP